MTHAAATAESHLNQLVQDWKRGSRTAFDQLWQNVECRLQRVARKMASPRAINEEGSLGFSNQVAIVVWRKRSTFHGETFDEFDNWSFAILQKVILKANCRRRLKTASIADDHAANAATISRLFRERDLAKSLLSKLSSDEAQLIRWFHMEQLSIQEIVGLLEAAKMSVKANTVCQRLRRARKHIIGFALGMDRD